MCLSAQMCCGSLLQKPLVFLIFFLISWMSLSIPETEAVVGLATYGCSGNLKGSTLSVSFASRLDSIRGLPQDSNNF